jgi:hypothetical protein
MASLILLATLGVPVWVAMDAYYGELAALPTNLGSDGRSRMEFHAWESAHFGFWVVLFTVSPFSLAALLIAALVAGVIRPRA